MSKFNPLSDGQGDRAQLEHFIDYFVKVMTAIIHKEDNSDVIPDDLRNKELLPTDLESVFREAWLVCRERDVPPLLESIRTVPIQQLQKNGLVGVELKAKLASLANISARLWSDQTTKLLKKLLEMIDSLLESILEAVPGGHGLVELKEAIENLLPD